ncbi:hypothetical protein [Serinibacter salmoneus]|uniref:hypothetical protein n=1 Tax=Serinibacter salmoneus TaxID=556530 RepID=UPI000BF5B25D|nr:hypothetical protein [Serinibacter salmoneus]
MCRTERLAATPDRDGMLTERVIPLMPTADDVRTYRDLARLADRLGEYDPIEFWLSAPFPLNLMDTGSYRLKRAVDAVVEVAEVDGAAVDGAGVDGAAVDGAGVDGAATTAAASPLPLRGLGYLDRGAIEGY